MEAFGAHVEVLTSPEGITPDLIPRMRARAADLAIALGAFETDQFRNTDMIAGYLGLGDELVEQVPGRIDALCLYIGTAGCFLGVGRALRAAHPALRRIAVEPRHRPRPRPPRASRPSRPSLQRAAPPHGCAMASSSSTERPARRHRPAFR